MSPLIRMHTAKELQAGGEKSSEASYLTILYYAWAAGENGYNDVETCRRAAASAGAESKEAARIASVVHENLLFAKSMNVFSDASNVLGLERGEHPVAHASGWEDERLVVGHILSPLLAPEAAFAIPNLKLMPESVRDMSSDRVSAEIVEIARKWTKDRIIFPETYNAIAARAKEEQVR